jgi:hypothetical protein
MSQFEFDLPSLIAPILGGNEDGGWLNGWLSCVCVELDFSLYSFTVPFVIIHCLKTQLMHYALKYKLKHNHSLKH